MSARAEQFKEFLIQFQNKIALARNLLKNANHHWADKVLNDLYAEIMKNEQIDAQKQFKLIMLISNSWLTYIKSLKYRKDLSIEPNATILYIDAIKRYFSFLIKLDDFYLLYSHFTDLLKEILKIEVIPEEAISKFIDSFSYFVRQKGDFLKLLELQILLIFLRKTFVPTELFTTSMKELNKIMKKIEPSKRAVFLHVLLENIDIKYGLSKDAEFIKEISTILLTRIPHELKSIFGNLPRIVINERTFPTLLPDLEELIIYLSDIGENFWITSILKNLYNKIYKYQTFMEAINYLNKFIKFFMKRNQFEIVHDLYNFLEEVYSFQSNVSYDKSLIELWAEAATNFLTMKEKKFLFQSFEKLIYHLKIPQTEEELYHYFYTHNYLWRLKSAFLSGEEREFWNMIFYRALFEEKKISFAQKIIPFLDPEIHPLLKDLNKLSAKGELFKTKIYVFEDAFPSENTFYDPNFILQKLIIQLSPSQSITCKMGSQNNEIKIITLENEFWNPTKLNAISGHLFESKEVVKENLTLKDTGTLLYLSLPRFIREYFSQFEISTLNFTPQLVFLTDELSIPFTLIYDKQFLMLNCSITHYSPNLNLNGINFPTDDSFQKAVGGTSEKNIKALVVELTNSKGPFKWNDDLNKKETLYPFPHGLERMEKLRQFFTSSTTLTSKELLVRESATHENILKLLKEKNFNIIHIIGNLIYFPSIPLESYLITSENETLKLKEIFSLISKDHDLTAQPLIFFDLQFFNEHKERILNPIPIISNIISSLQLNNLTGIVFRTNSTDDEISDKITFSFYDNLLNGQDIGTAMLNARKQFISEDMINAIERKLLLIRKMAQNAPSQEILKIFPYFLIFGLPWNRLS
ncbi:MAG: CHAT domain-containing protein [Promethearchaeota archaeon]